MNRKIIAANRSGRVPRLAGTVTVLASVIALVLGLVLVESLFVDLNASFRVSESAIDAIGETIDVVDRAISEIDESLDAAGASLVSVATAAEIATTGLEDVAVFLEEDLPADVEAISDAMPAAIQTAEAIDGALSALAFFGVDYNPDEPFDRSLRRVDSALRDMPAELRVQSENIRALIPSAAELGTETSRLAEAVDALEGDLAEIHQLVGTYRVTVDEAQLSIEETTSRLGESAWLLRTLVVVLGLGGLLVGFALISLGRTIDTLVVVEEPEPEALPEHT